MKLPGASLHRIVIIEQPEELHESKESSFFNTEQVAVKFSFLFFSYKTWNAARELVEEAATAGQHTAAHISVTEGSQTWTVQVKPNGDTGTDINKW